MQTPFFRPEAVAARRDQSMGELSIVHPLPVGRILAASSALVLVLATGVAAATYRQYVTVAGTVVPSKGMVTLQAPESGIVVWRAQPEGAKVSVGEALVEIDTGTKTRDGDVSEVTDSLLRSQRRSLEASLDTERAKVRALLTSLDKRRQTYRTESSYLREQLSQASAQAVIAEKSLQRMNLLLDQKLISALEHARAESELLSRRGSVLDLERQIVALQRQLDELDEEADLAHLSLRALEGDLQRRSLAIEQQRAENDGRGQSIVRSTHEGRIGAWAARLGESVSARTPLVTVIPSGSRLEVHLAVPPSAIGQMRQGQPVSIACDAFPYQQFGRLRGTVTRVALAPTPGSGEEAEFQAVIALEEDTLSRGAERHALRPGMSVTAEIYVRRTGVLADWVGAAKELVRSILA